MEDPASASFRMAADGRRAQLVLALLLLALAPMFLLGRPIQTHAVKLNLPPLEGAVVALPRPTFLMMSSLIRFDVPLAPGPSHILEIMPDERVVLDGADVDLVQLRQALDVIAASEGGRLDLRPHPWARYETVFEVLALIRRANMDRLDFANGRFAGALDEGA